MRSRLLLVAAVLAVVSGVLGGFPAAARAASGDVLFVVATPGALSAGETAVRTRIAAAGFTVTLADDDTVTAAQASGRALVLIGQSSNSNSAAVKSLAGIAIPVWVAKPYLFDDFGLTGPIAETDYGTKGGAQLTITDPASPMAAGRSGTVTIQSGGQLSWGRPTAAAAVVARAGTAASVFTVAPGATLATGRPAPACRLTFPLYGNGPATFTPDGWALFDAAAHSAAANCQATPPPPPPPPPPPSGVQHVVLVSIDGLNPQAITTLGAAGTPSLHRIMAEGVSTLDARTEYEATRTLPDHTSMITSRRVDAAAGGHGVIFDDDNGSTVAAAAGSYVAGVFDVVHDSGGTTALYATKPKFDFFDRSWDATNGAPDVTGADNGRDKIDTYARGAATAMTDALQASLLAAPPELSMIHYAGPDGAGHTYGFLSDSYLAEVTRTDALVGELLDTIAGNQALAASTVVIVTSDHGGSGTSHADPTLAADYTVPFLAWGAGVAAGADLYALNPDRADPGTARPDYTAVPQPVRNGEAGNLATGLLGLGPIPGSGLDRDESLDLR